MKASSYPFAAIVGQPRLKLALLLAAVDWRLSVLLQGDKGSGKSTAARGLGEILPASAPFVNLPIGATEDRLLGGLNLDRLLRGEASLKPGLIQEAYGGVLYIDEVNLLADTLTDALLDVAAGGRHYLERDGFSASSEANFVLLGSMNREEGGLRPQLLDRFALALDVEAPAVAEERARIMAERLRFDSDPIAFRAEWEAEQQRLRQTILDARERASAIPASPTVLVTISQAIAAAGVRSLRADLAALRAAIAHAALAGHGEVAESDIESILPLVLLHREARHPQPPAAPAPKSSSAPAPEKAGEAPGEAKDLIFPASTSSAPGLRVALADAIVRGRSAPVQSASGAGAVRSSSSPAGGTLNPAASLIDSFCKTGAARLQRDHLIFRTPQPRSGLRWIFVLDASGSHAVQQRMRAVKGAVAALLASAVDARDEVAVLAFRGAKAEIVLAPCRDPGTALRTLEFLPTGGRTPLAHALELASSLVTPASVLVLLTDGQANVSCRGGHPWEEALQAAGNLKCASVLVDSSTGGYQDRLQALALALRARVIPLDDFNDTSLAAMC